MRGQKKRSGWILRKSINITLCVDCKKDLPARTEAWVYMGAHSHEGRRVCVGCWPARQKIAKQMEQAKARRELKEAAQEAA